MGARFFRGAMVLVAWATGGVAAWAHPEPDVPVRGFFEAGGQSAIEIEIDVRCFAESPVDEPYLQKWVLDEMTEAEREGLVAKARAFVGETVAFVFEPIGRVVPDFEFRFTTMGGEPLAEIGDPVMMLGRWETTLPAGVEGYRIEALPEGGLSVVFVNKVDGAQVERLQVLFPGEDSYLLDLTRLAADMPTAAREGAVRAGDAGKWATFVSFLREGFVHVVPLGLDHILFVLGVFLLSRKWRPLLWQVTMFTLAHTITLALATLGYVSVPASVVEPVIAASIAVVALENIFHARYTPWRLVVIFVFGLIHGLGFAGALSELELPPASLVTGLLGFNVGVELGQLAVIAAAFAVTAWLRDEKKYRRYVVIPGSVAIAVCGLWWAVERTLA